jgi:tetratricopeptide (TPR) repeat protein
MWAQFWPSGTLIHKHCFALVYLDMGDSAKAIELLELTYEIRMKQYSKESAAVCRTLSCLGTAYSHHGDLELSCKTFERAFTEQQKCFPEGHPNIGVTLHHMGSNFWRMKNYQRAMECYRDSLNMLQRFMHAAHPEISSVKEKMQHLEQELHNSLQISP